MINLVLDHGDPVQWQGCPAFGMGSIAGESQGFSGRPPLFILLEAQNIGRGREGLAAKNRARGQSHILLASEPEGYFLGAVIQGDRYALVRHETVAEIPQHQRSTKKYKQAQIENRFWKSHGLHPNRSN